MSLYVGCKPSAVQWSQRLHLIKQELSNPRLDIICLQEVNHYHFEADLRPFMTSLGFHHIYKRRNGMKQDGEAVFFRRNRFELDCCRKVDFDYKAVFPSESQRENVGIIARLVPVDRNNRNRLVVATTHLLWNPKRGDIKFAQLRYFISEVMRMAFENSATHEPVILCGDFNSVPDSPIIQFLLQGSVSPVGFGCKEISGQEPGRGKVLRKEDLVLWGIGMDSTAHENEESWRKNVSSLSAGSTELPVISHPFHFRSVYRHRTRDGMPFASTKVEGESCLVDHIFYASPTGSLTCLSYKKLYTQQQMQTELGWLPDDVIPSDHLPLEAKFLLMPHK